MDGLLQDVRYAVRTLSSKPAFATITVLTLALGIGANLAIFTIVNTVLLQPLPFREPERLVRVFDDLPGAGARDVGMSIPELEDLSERSGVFEKLSAIYPSNSALSGGDQVQRIGVLGTSPNYFEVLGATPALGRVYTQAEWVPGFLDAAVISDGLWKSQFGSDPQVIGRRVRVDEDGYTIVGVMPPEFRHPGNTAGGDIDMWLGTGFKGDPWPAPWLLRGARTLPGVLGRLKPEVTLEQAQRRLDALTASLQQAYPNDYPKQLGWSIRLVPAQASLTGNVRPTLVILLAAVSFVLLIVCVNVASLLIARASARTREFAIRQALGASPGQLIRQLLTESMLMSLAGGAAALIVLQLAQSALLAMMPAEVPRLAEVHADWRMVAFALVLSLATGVVIGLMPALQASATDPNRDLKDAGSAGAQSLRQSRSRATLVVLEVALSAVLLIGAGLLVRSFSATLSQDPGLDPRRLVAGQIWVPVPNDPKANQYLTPAQRAGLARELLARLALLPGMEQTAIGTSSDIPLLGLVNNPRPFSLDDEASAQDNDHAAEFGAVSARYFDALKTPLRTGRVFTDHDAEGSARVVVVNEAFVRRFSPQRDAVGRRLRYVLRSDKYEAEIVGVVGDVRNDGLDVAAPPRVYQSILQYPVVRLAVFLRARSEADVKAAKEALTATVHGINPELPVFEVRTMAELRSASLARRQFSLFLMSVFAVIALLLAALGIYGVMAFVVSQRAQEFAIRLALGAEPRDILGLAFRPGLILTVTGTLVGLGVAAVVTRLMSSLLFGVSSSDPMTFAVVPMLLGVTTMAACFLPARRATRVSPMQVLK
jgi:predicted permease